MDTLIRGVHKNGGRVALGFHVTSILPEGAGTLRTGSEAPAAAPAPPERVPAAVAMAPPATAASEARSERRGSGAAAAQRGSTAERRVATGATSSGGSSMFGWPTGPGTADGDKAGGVEVRAADGSVHSVRARHAVVCNASVWDTVGLLDAGGLQGGVRAGVAAEVAEEATLRSMATNGSRDGSPQGGNGAGKSRGAASPGEASGGQAGYVTDEAFEEYVRDLEMNESMMHLHVGFRAREGARPCLACMYVCIRLAAGWDLL